MTDDESKRSWWRTTTADDLDGGRRQRLTMMWWCWQTTTTVDVDDDRWRRWLMLMNDKTQWWIRRNSFIFFFILFTRNKLSTTGNSHSIAQPQTQPRPAPNYHTHYTRHTPTDLWRQLIYGRCCCVKVLYIPRGSAKTLKYMGAKAIKT